MWAPSMGLTFKAISTTCQDTGRGRYSETGERNSSKEKQKNREGELGRESEREQKVYNKKARKGHTQDDAKTQQSKQ